MAHRRSKQRRSSSVPAQRQPHEQLPESTPSGPLTPQRVLQLQRTLGNRQTQQLLAAQPGQAPLVQRLIYAPENQQLRVPQTFMHVRIPWNDQTKYADIRAVRNDDPTLETIYQSNKGKILEYVGASLGLTIYDIVKSNSDQALADLLPPSDQGMSGKDKRAIKNALKDVFNSLSQLFTAGDNDYSRRVYDVADVKPQHILLPKDMIPETPDLPASGQSIKGTQGLSAPWGLVCSLIALVKQEGYAAVQQKTEAEAAPTNLKDAVQMLHDHYKKQGVEYDDTSTHLQLFKEWGYNLIFVGPVSFAQLRRRIGLTTGKKYIFDIEGHTVRIAMKKNMLQQNADIVNLDEYFTKDSDPENYKTDEFLKPIMYIYAK